MSTTPNPAGSLARIAAAGGRNWRVLAELVILAGIGYSWLQAHDAKIAAEMMIHQKEQQISQRDAQNASQQKDMENLKQSITTLAAAKQALPQVIQLPVEPKIITFPPNPTPQQVAQSSNSAGGAGLKAGQENSPGGTLPDAPQPQSGLFYPTADAIVLSKRLADCKGFESSLATCQADFGDMKKERDAAVKASKGGGFWRRLKSNSEFLVLGAAGGLVAVCGTGHCR